MADLASEIMEYFKRKDGPSPLKLWVTCGNNYSPSITITAPVENGELVWKVALGRGAPCVAYPSGAVDVVAHFIDGKFSPHAGGDLMLIVSKSEGGDSMANWLIGKELHNKKSERMAEIRPTLSLLSSAK